VKVRWTPQAERDREEIFDYIAGFDEAAAERMNGLFERAVAQIKRFPLSAREGKMPGSREIIPHPSYRLVYEIRDDTIWIATLYHTSRQWPPADDETS
jgi:toxin ParE1/3/4